MILTINAYSPQIHSSAFVAANATVIGRVTIGQGASLWFQTVVRGDVNEIAIGANTNIQDGCLLHVTNEHKLIVGECVTVGHGAILHGCTIESTCLISMGAIVLDGAIIGSGSIVAAGAVVSPGSIVPANSLVMGIPGKVIRPVRAQDKALIESGWQNYLNYAKQYKQLPAVEDPH
jgi:carbonic anhydrase/acetyltransferase-like protein (isoleucine patch superfamily)